MKTSAGQEVTAVSKFICINCPFHAQPRTVLALLISSQCSVEVFNSRAVKTMLHWRWKISARNKHLALLAIHLMLAVLFFAFTALYCTHKVWEEEHYPDTGVSVHVSDPTTPRWHLRPAKSILLVCLLVVWFALSAVFDPLL